VAQIWQDLREEASRGIQDSESRVARGSPAVILPPWARSRASARIFGVVSIVTAVALVEMLIRVGVINRFIVPLPSQIVASLPRIISEENVLHRFWQTTQEVWASLLLAVVGSRWVHSCIAFESCAWRAKPGSVRLPRRRSFLLTRCSWFCSGAVPRRSLRSASSRVSRR
jgi:hypothetical protein